MGLGAWTGEGHSACISRIRCDGTHLLGKRALLVISAAQRRVACTRSLGPYPPSHILQYGDAPEKAYGKRQRLRQAGLWLVDPLDYYRCFLLHSSQTRKAQRHSSPDLRAGHRAHAMYMPEALKLRRRRNSHFHNCSGRFITVADSGASFPPVSVGNNGTEWRKVRPQCTSLTFILLLSSCREKASRAGVLLMRACTFAPRQAIRRHFAEDLLRRRTVRNLLAAARALNRTAVLPRALCYCDKMWNNLQFCRAAGAWAMPLPFECPMDHLYLVPVRGRRRIALHIPPVEGSPRALRVSSYRRMRL